MADENVNEIPPASVTLKPAYRRVNLAMTVPGSKSIANRALLLAAFAQGDSVLREVPESDDISAALSALSALGVPVDNPEPGVYRIRGGAIANTRCEIDIRSSGTVGRFLPGLLAAQPDGEWILRSTPQLAGRPLTPLLDGLARCGGRVERLEADKSFPLRVRGGGLVGGAVDISAAGSSQFASGLMLAAPLAAKETALLITDVDPEEAYLDLTLDVMRRFGVSPYFLRDNPRRLVHVAAGQRYRAADMSIEADYNSALYFLCLPLLVGGTVRVRNLAPDSGQPGRKFLSVIRRLGGTVTEDADGVEVWGSGGTLDGGFAIDMRAMSEMALTLGVLAVFASAPISMTNLAHIRGHETNRIAALTDTLRRFGVQADADADSVRVHPFPPRELGHLSIDSLGDHRMAMAFALLGVGGNGLTITGADAVSKTFPDFFRRLAESGVVL